jgi:hypothetical protein
LLGKGILGRNQRGNMARYLNKRQTRRMSARPQANKHGPIEARLISVIYGALWRDFMNVRRRMAWREVGENGIVA